MYVYCCVMHISMLPFRCVLVRIEQCKMSCKYQLCIPEELAAFLPSIIDCRGGGDEAQFRDLILKLTN